MFRPMRNRSTGGIKKDEDSAKTADVSAESLRAAAIWIEQLEPLSKSVHKKRILNAKKLGANGMSSAEHQRSSVCLSDQVIYIKKKTPSGPPRRTIGGGSEGVGLPHHSNSNNVHIPHPCEIFVGGEPLSKSSTHSQASSAAASRDDEYSPEKTLEDILNAEGQNLHWYKWGQLPNDFFESHRQRGASSASDVNQLECTEFDTDLVQAVRLGDLTALRRFLQDEELENEEGSHGEICSVGNSRLLQCRNRSGETLMHIACRQDQVAIVKFLLTEARASLRVADSIGRTPLHHAFWTTDPSLDLIDLILDECPDLLLVRDDRGHSPLNYVRQRDQDQWNSYLLSKRKFLSNSLTLTTRIHTSFNEYAIISAAIKGRE